MTYKHISVLLEECINLLNIKPDGVYYDGTCGGGGHTLRILKELSKGKLICVDQDEMAIKNITNKLQNDDRVLMFCDRFASVHDIMRESKLTALDGVLLDLGVSSYQIDTPERGFSFQKNGPLDMRMGKNGINAKEVINNFVVEDIVKMLYDFGEERYALSIAKNIEKCRKIKPIETTFELVEIIKKSVPMSYSRNKHPAKKTFQALRIYVNDELTQLRDGIDNCFEKLNSGGRLLIISFHSLEDRIVKQKYRQLSNGCICDKSMPICVCNRLPRGKIITKKPILPSLEEQIQNSRSKSAKLRVIEKA